MTSFAARARLVPDEIAGTVLEIDGRPQSHVDLADPTHIRYEYLRRIATVLDTLAPEGEPITALHLGAGALTLPRYVQATRPGSRQLAVEIDPELPGLVLDALPLPAGTDLEVVIGDAREELAAMTAADGRPARFDAIVLDVFSGAHSPAHLACEDFYAEALAHLTEGGALLVNVGDDPPLGFWADQALALLDAADAAGCPGAWTLTDRTMLELESEGNLVLTAGPGLSTDRDRAEASIERWLAAGPHPAAVLDPEETEDLAQTILG